jgi:ribosomal protein S18 acetylase RimI-like enzyme
MPQIEIRPAVSPDIIELINLDHSCKTSYVWQMDRNINEGQFQITFREIRLPRPIQVPYPRLAETLADEWQLAAGLLVATHNGKLVGYTKLNEVDEIHTVVIKDIVVDNALRRQGVGTTLILAVQNWAIQRNNRKLMFEMPSKNFPAIKLAFKLGFEFSGYNDSYYPNKDIALFFSRFLK